MKWPIFWRLNLILFLWILASLAFFARPARADIARHSDRTNYHLQNTNRKIEIQKSDTSVTNKYAPSLKDGIEFGGLDLLDSPPHVRIKIAELFDVNVGAGHLIVE